MDLHYPLNLVLKQWSDNPVSHFLSRLPCQYSLLLLLQYLYLCEYLCLCAVVTTVIDLVALLINDTMWMNIIQLKEYIIDRDDDDGDAFGFKTSGFYGSMASCSKLIEKKIV